MHSTLSGQEKQVSGCAGGGGGGGGGGGDCGGGSNDLGHAREKRVVCAALCQRQLIRLRGRMGAVRTSIPTNLQWREASTQKAQNVG
eukprot:5711511-Pleurochrysis_carterae.AAC.2